MDAHVEELRLLKRESVRAPARSLVVFATRDDTAFITNISHAAQDHAGIDAAKTEGIAHDVIQLGVATMMRDDIEIARRIGIIAVQRRRYPTLLDRHGTNRGLDRSRRAQG